MLLHGGPGVAGQMAPIARRLADSFHVFEPWQRGSGGEPLTVARHVDDLHDLVTTRCAGARPALVGWSWGAMLALAYAAAHPDRVSRIVLVGSGTFDTASRDRLHAALRERTDDRLRRRIARLAQEIPDPDERLAALGSLTLPLYSHDLLSNDTETEVVDARAYQETWDDMLGLQASGVFPTGFQAIRVPVLMLHGADDPHPGPMIRATLVRYIPHLEYREWKRCGHYPWLERAAGEEFFAALRRWLHAPIGGARHRDASRGQEP